MQAKAGLITTQKGLLWCSIARSRSREVQKRWLTEPCEARGSGLCSPEPSCPLQSDMVRREERTLSSTAASHLTSEQTSAETNHRAKRKAAPSSRPLLKKSTQSRQKRIATSAQLTVATTAAVAGLPPSAPTGVLVPKQLNWTGAVRGEQSGCSPDRPSVDSSDQTSADSGALRDSPPCFNFWVDEAVLAPGAVYLVLLVLQNAGGYRTGGAAKRRAQAASQPEELGCNNMAAWDLLWTRSRYARLAAPQLQPGQMINLIPGLQHVTGKKKLVETLRSAYGEMAWELTPRSFQLPEDLEQWRDWTVQQRCPEDQLWMLKSGANRGYGLQLSGLADALADARRPLNHSQFKRFCVAQRYVVDPMLISGRKFHLRLWVVVTGHSPLRAYLHRNGLVLFSTAPYQVDEGVSASGVGVGEGHVTNYAQNENGMVWSLDQLKVHLGAQRFQGLWASMARSAALVVSAGLSSVLEAQDKYGHPHDSGFQLLGFDFLLDDSWKPWVLEVNEYPSMKVAHSDPMLKALIHQQKEGMVTDMIQIIKHRLTGTDAEQGSSAAPWEQELQHAGRFVPLMPLFPLADPKLEADIPWGPTDLHMHRHMRRINMQH